MSDRHADLNIEAWAIAECLRDNAAIDTYAADLSAADFSDPIHQRAFSLLLTLRCDGAKATPAVLQSHMRADLDEIEGGQGYFRTITAGAPVTTPTAEYVKILKALSVRRSLAAIGQFLMEGADKPASEEPTDRLSGEALEGLLQIGGHHSRPAEIPAAVASRVLERAHSHLRGEKPDFVTTGIKKLDKALGGLQPTDFLSICARAGMAKTAVLRKITLSSARAGNPTLFFSKEMSSDQLVQSMLCDIDHEIRGTDVPPIQTWKFRAGCLSNFELHRLEEARKVLEGLPLEICDDADLTMQAIVARSRAFKSRFPGKIGLVAVDFLQIIGDETAGRGDSREQIVTRLAYSHKRLAKMLGWAVAAAVQLKNKGDGKTPSDRLPTEEDVRESGGVIMASDSSIGLHRKAFFLKQLEPAVPKDRDEHREWREKLAEVEFDLHVRGFKHRHGDPAALNLELWADLSCGAIRDERPGRYHLPSEQAELDSERPF